jgi:hypothetical protein
MKALLVSVAESRASRGLKYPALPGRIDFRLGAARVAQFRRVDPGDPHGGQLALVDNHDSVTVD